MTYSQTSQANTFGIRAQSLQSSAYALRQHVIKGGSDIEGWRLARRMREASSLHQFSAVERELGDYLQRHRIDLTNAA
jgi:hypothetical protein